ncbi:MAG TPA: ATP-dependent sacrificial sulfur transferase LarE [Pirellulales bacterium]|nr:ATP-dependent sacrificial sulfur transferase LarE [Pirellulales bacterium]
MLPAEKTEKLLALLRSYGSCAVAFSGGVDSAVVAKAAQLALGQKAVAVTGVSASLAEGELEAARQIAQQIGIRHEVLQTDEFADANYTSNPAIRCYFCKTELYEQLEPLAAQLGLAVIVNGANVDDAGDWRPGMKAAGEHRVRSPLLECGFTKQDVRALAAEWNLPVWDKPASPCLSSRVAYGEEVSTARLQMIDRAEQLLRSLGLRTVRVRYHKGDLARLEVPSEAIATLAEPKIREYLSTELKLLGFKYVTLDLEGFRSGSQNEALETSGLLPIISENDQ